jgi:hypothetical protein
MLRIASVCLLAITIVLPIASLAAPMGSPTETPLPDVEKQPPTKPVTYGLCDAPQNADAFPSSPVRVVPGTCQNSQQFTATSPGPSTGGNCGGFTVAFGPMGDLKPYLNHSIILRADWGDTALTAATCAQAKVAAVAWGARCTDKLCTTAEWEKIGGPKQRTGTWNTTSGTCYISVQFNSSDKEFKTLNIDVIATLPAGGQTVRKRAKGYIYVSQPNGKCLSAPAKPTRKETP